MGRGQKLLDPLQRGTEAEQLRRELHARIAGQEEAIGQIVDVYQTHLTGMSSPDRPIGSFLFLGPTGTGKTRLVEALAESLVGDARAVVKVDCGEFQHGHEIAKLIGSPPGYLGHRETHPALSQKALDLYHTEQIKISFVLFDEIEKASDTLWNLLLGVLDKGVLTLGDNQKVSFSQSMIFMTSNLGASEMEAALRPKLGFTGSQPQPEAEVAARLSGIGMAAARRRFTPEFINRIDRIAVFHALGEAELRRILELELRAVQQRLNQSSRPFRFTLSETAKDFLLQEGCDRKYGARHLKRTIERELLHPLSALIASSQVLGGDRVSVSLNDGRGALSFYKETEARAPRLAREAAA